MWFWLWLLFVFLVLVVPLGYGMGHRRWSMPYPGFFRRYLPSEMRPDDGVDARQDKDLAPRRETGAARQRPKKRGLRAGLFWVALVIAVVWLVIGVLV